MTYLKKYVDQLSVIKKEYLELGESKFIKKYSKYESLIGPEESINFIN
jgi:hypothetical protein